ncbi:valine--tRNA ligase isoform A [Chlorella sorokiniana]|uniref:Valine--tRNA ligase, mitochondrial n=1 Tax=Chlorella sorokiniana TaxID=3076 RepID=A0A2P6TRS5_CHLSO|nr:valine--tRNA ligase isoform A [Chlorella sorokiniana]|eukprot:PRW56769.1 valine--tRNA ligase isoform A [Chlorella sorokiniana]
MASLLAPWGGHPAQNVALIAAQFSNLKLTIQPPDADAKEPVLTTADGQKIAQSEAIARYVATTGGTADLYPASSAAAIDGWLATAAAIEAAAAAWCQPTCGAATPEQRGAARQQLEAALAQLEAALASSAYLAGAAPTIADVAVLAALLPLFQEVLGQDVQQQFAAVTRWLQACAAQPQFAAVLGSLALCQQAASWAEPAAGGAAAEGGKKKKKKKGGAGGGEDGASSSAPSTQASSAANLAEMDPEKAARKAAKLAEKEAKKAKAAAKAAAKATSSVSLASEGAKASKKAEQEAKRAAEAAEAQAWVDAARATPTGDKKTLPAEMPKGYVPKAVEAAWYEWWQQCGFFKPDLNSDKPPFVIVIPPPNVTGSLHIGHALTNAIEDTIVRWRRMSGYNTVWVPGTDHAGIATQTVVEKKIAREQGKTRHDLGREGFLEEVWKWVREYGDRICDQLRRLGSSVDWDRKAFTMDDNLSAAVKEAFVRLHAEGLIYRDNRLVNWCCKLRTAVSDIEVDYIDIPKRSLLSVPGYDEPVEFGVLTSFAYPLEDGSGEIVVATTRVETMLGDTAVAVHPEDPRYAHLHGKHVMHPVNGRRIPIICDAELVDMSFGTGAVKITPAHDPNDFQTGKRHNLEFINVFDDNGNINTNGTGQFAGQPRFKARTTVVEFLKEKGLFRGTLDNPMRLGLCSRSKDVIEPVLKPQWWVNCQGMAAEGCAAVRDGRLEIIPRDFEKTWFQWMENIRDWCVSRQLWWGHRIPAYYVLLEDEAAEARGNPGAPSEHMDRWVVGRDEAAALEAAQQRFPGRPVKLVQDEDVLDTWFSSGLFPFSVFGWPNQTPDLAKFYPTALLETGHDILFFWVARMVMMGMKLTGEVPFKQVFLHSLVRDAHGRKMSKSLGNVIDPINVIEGITLDGLYQTLLGGNLDPKEVEKAAAGQRTDFPDGIEECGTDALRFALVAYTSQGRDINLDIKRVVSYRHWCNKLWNAIRFAMLNLGEGFQPSEQLDAASLPFACKWILSKLNAAVATTVKGMEAYEFSTATSAVYSFWQYELCDVFIELIKPTIYQDDAVPGAAAAKQATRDTLWICLETGLRLLHPFMPFVTEELWQRLPRRPGQQQAASIMIADYPAPVEGWSNEAVEADMAYLLLVVNRTRSLRADYDLTSRHKPPMLLRVKDAGKAALLAGSIVELVTLTGNGSCEMLAEGQAAPHGCGVAIVDDVTTVYLSLSGVLDAAKELEKLGKREADAAGKVEQLQKKLAMPSYQEKTPEEIKAADLERLVKSEAELESIRHHIEDMKKLLDS